jgi:murein DD-endopeptidase MepM/ murein hydrolase activator NlpD
LKANKKTTNRIIIDLLVAAAILFIAAYTYQYFFLNNTVDSDLTFDGVVNPLPEKQTKYGFDLDEVHIEEYTIFPDQFLSEILTNHEVSIEKVFELERKSKDIFNVRNIKAGKKYSIVKIDSCGPASCFIYEPDPYRFVKYTLSDSVQVEIIDRPVTTCIETACGEVSSSLWNSMIEQHLSPNIISKMEDALAWSLDFYHTQKGDKYKLVFERKLVDGEPVGIGKLLGAYYKNYDNEYFAIFYESEKYAGFYDLEGRPTKKGFLKSPVKFSRISSTYSLNRLHPVLKKRRPHFGTDYAAPYGTPIRAVANGVVTHASYTKGNGKYVKIKHDKTYQTQYLHMQKFAKGIHAGVHVKQGQTIGYVGSTGLATGPHVCYRFWKNGKQVNHLRENFPPPEPMPEKELPNFFEIRDDVVEQLDHVSFKPVLHAEEIHSEFQ